MSADTESLMSELLTQLEQQKVKTEERETMTQLWKIQVCNPLQVFMSRSYDVRRKMNDRKEKHKSNMKNKRTERDRRRKPSVPSRENE